MRQILGSVMFLTMAIPLIAADDKADALKKLNGTYEVISLVKEGKPDESKKGMATFTFKDGTITITESKGKEETASFTIDSSKKPAQIDIKPEKGPPNGIPGIYELKETDKGTELTIAISFEGSTRPKDFKGEEKGTGVIKLFRKKEK